jgi:hypothetical protein
MATNQAIEQTSNTALDKLTQRLAELKAKSELAIVDSDTLVRSAEAKLEFESYIRSVEAHFEPELAPAEETVARCKLAMSQLVTPVKGWLKSLVDRQRNYHAEEKRKAEAEARRINEENRRAAAIKAEEERKERERQAEADRKAREKEIEAQRKSGEIKAREAERLRKEAVAAAEREKQRAAEDAVLAANDVPEVKVLPNLPKGAGLPNNRTFYFAEVTNGSAILFAYDKAIRDGDKDRAAFLSRFVMVDEKEVGAFARQMKDNEGAALLLPGVKFTSKG